MTRNMEIVRRIILAVKEAQGPVNWSDVADIGEREFAFHAQLLEEAGLVTAACRGRGEKSVADSAIIFRLTWAGCDFADAIANETLWHKAQETVMKPSASWTFGVLLRYLESEIAANLPVLKHFL